MAWDFHELQNFGRRDTPSLQAFRDPCPEYDVKETSNLVDAQAFIKDGTLSIRRVVRLMDQLAKTKEACLTHKNKHETGAARLKDLASKRIR